MRYTEARAILSEAIELLSEGPSERGNKMENKPSTNKSEYKLTKPVAKPSAQGRATNSPVVKFGKRTTSRRYVTRANRWALRQIARNKSAVSEAIEQLDEATRAEIKRDRAHEAKFKKIRKGNNAYLRSNLKNVKKAGHKGGLTKLGLDYGLSESELDEGTRRTARLSAAVAKAQKKGKKVGPRSPLAKAASKARAKYMRSEDKRELKPGAIENRMKWQAKYPGPSQPRGFGSYGF